MLNFTSELKREVMSVGFSSAREKSAALCAFLCTNADLYADGFRITTETEEVAEVFLGLFEELFSLSLEISSAGVDRLSGRGRIVFSAAGDCAKAALAALGVSKGAERAILALCERGEGERAAFLRAAFLGSGSCIIPAGGRAGYHLEIVFSAPAAAEACCELLDSLQIFARTAERKGDWIVYLKSKEAIADCLHLLSAVKGLDKFFRLVEERDRNNRINRANNCLVGNFDKSAAASAEQRVEIATIAETIGLDKLEPELMQVAKARLSHPEDSYRELAERLDLTKSALSRRMKRLAAIAKKLTEERHD